MAREGILEKLNKALQEDIHEECQVVYILSRIRKMLEINNEKNKFKYLNFYCNWALHAKIDRTEPVADVLRGFIESKDDDRFLKFDPLAAELRAFLKENNLSDKIFEKKNYLRFLNLLVNIYSDTPVILTANESRTIRIKKPLKAFRLGLLQIEYEIV